MKNTELKRRLKALGFTEPSSAAAIALGIERSSLYRMWHGKRAIPQRVMRALALVEAAQPARMTVNMRRALLTSTGEVGSAVTWPEARSRFEIHIDWRDVFDALEDGRLVKRWGKQYLLTELGARCVDFLHKTAPEMAAKS